MKADRPNANPALTQVRPRNSMLQRPNFNWLWLAGAALLLAAPARSDERLDAVAAPGRFTGPPLWRVSKADHELWLFGTLSVVPKEMKWSPAGVERAIAASQEVLLPPGVRASTLKPMALVRLWRRVRELSGNPDGKPLAQVLPADVYRRYAVLRDRYARRERNLEDLRPIIVAGRVYEGAVESMGLVSGRDVETGIERAARRAGVKTTDTKLHADPEVLLEHAARVPAPAEVDCFAKVIAEIEADEQRLAARARAWAVGDLEALQRFDYPDIRRECLAFPGWPVALKDALNDANDAWLAAAERALAANRSTFATVDLRDLVTQDGLLAQLRERGYEVRAPER
jgi:uncharacterized protein YbaP (TraB family)